MTSKTESFAPAAISSQAQPLPAEHVGSPLKSQESSPRTSRPTSLHNELPLRLKSSSIGQPARSNRSRHRHTASSIPIPRTSPEPDEESQEASSRETDFLTALAAKERRVLELKDELQRAEDDLLNLKKQWAQQESSTRRQESKRLHQMRPMSVSITKDSRLDDTDGSSAWMYEEMERRKALMGHGHTRTASRRAFSGSRHAKQLSLIPPTREQNDASLTQPVDDSDSGPCTNNFGRSQTTSDLPAAPQHRSRGSQSPRREVLQAGKQMATDWREGLWTFFEDLKHATVGDDVRNEPRQGGGRPGLPRSNSTAEALRRTRGPINRSTGINQMGPVKPIQPHDDAPLLDAGNDFWKEHGLEPPKEMDHATLTNMKKQKTPQKLVQGEDADNDSWETWDSPSPSNHKRTSPTLSSGDNSAAHSGASASPSPSSPATSLEATPRASIGSVSANAKGKDSIPWPALNKLGPAQLRRTASHLMDEWERSLTPSNNDESRQRRPYDDRKAEQEFMS